MSYHVSAEGHGSHALIVAFVVAALSWWVLSRRKASLPYPPGPKGQFLVGNIFDLPPHSEWVAYNRWCRELGSDLVYLRVAGKGILVLDTLEAANDLFDKRSSIYSSRPQFPMVGELMGWKWLFAGMEYGEPWRERRRLFTKYFSPTAAAKYGPIKMKFVREMLPCLLDTPEDFLEIVRHALGGLTISLAYGLPIKKVHDPYIDLAERAMAALAAGSLPGAFLVNVIPLLKYIPDWFPGAGFKRKAKQWRKLQEDFRGIPFEQTAENMAAGTANPCFTTACLEKLSESKDPVQQRELIKDTAGIVFAAGADTIISTTQTFFSAMLCFPEAQKKAQEELDRVLSGRLPEFDDEADMPYMAALVREILRWQTAVPVAIPHSTTADDVYKGYFIPKGTLVMGNVWAMLRDEKHYPEPSKFYPERFLKDGKLNPDVLDPIQIVFGWGRRSCPGSHIALSLVWLTAATVLSVFDISRAIDENGNEIEPSSGVQPGLICPPLPFKCTIKPRSEDAVELIKSVADTV
ncbi:cytochrome P450 [Agrocybe pediades]|nr:cytochrome P450 [Agrocybe pediades]